MAPPTKKKTEEKKSSSATVKEGGSSRSTLNDEIPAPPATAISKTDAMEKSDSSEEITDASYQNSDDEDKSELSTETNVGDSETVSEPTDSRSAHKPQSTRDTSHTHDSQSNAQSDSNMLLSFFNQMVSAATQLSPTEDPLSVRETEPTMTVQVKSAMRAVPMACRVPLDAAVLDLKLAIDNSNAEMSLSPACQQLTFGTRTLDNDAAKLTDLGIRHGSTVHLSATMFTGPRSTPRATAASSMPDISQSFVLIMSDSRVPSNRVQRALPPPAVVTRRTVESAKTEQETNRRTSDKLKELRKRRKERKNAKRSKSAMQLQQQNSSFTLSTAKEESLKVLPTPKPVDSPTSSLKMATQSAPNLGIVSTVIAIDRPLPVSQSSSTQIMTSESSPSGGSNVKPNKKKICCSTIGCTARLRVVDTISGKCHCGRLYCRRHRDAHECPFDHRGKARADLLKEAEKNKIEDQNKMDK